MQCNSIAAYLSQLHHLLTLGLLLAFLQCISELFLGSDFHVHCSLLRLTHVRYSSLV